MTTRRRSPLVASTSNWRILESASSTQIFALLYSAVSGAVVQAVSTDPGGGFAFSRVEDGKYFVYGAGDESGDKLVGVPGRLWGALGGHATPTPITVLSEAPHTASFTIGLPEQIRPNQSFASANDLVIGGYTRSILTDSLEIDFYRVKIPVAGTYTFETSGWVSACGFALEEATAIGLFDAAQNLLRPVADYIDPSHLNYCSRLTRSLKAGTYYVGVAGLFNGLQYQLQARAGP